MVRTGLKCNLYLLGKFGRCTNAEAATGLPNVPEVFQPFAVGSVHSPFYSSVFEMLAYRPLFKTRTRLHPRVGAVIFLAVSL